MLLHFDPRSDNVVIDDHGTARLVDRSRARIGPARVDLVCLLMESDLGHGTRKRSSSPVRPDAMPILCRWKHRSGSTCDGAPKKRP